MRKVSALADASVSPAGVNVLHLKVTTRGADLNTAITFSYCVLFDLATVEDGRTLRRTYSLIRGVLCVRRRPQSILRRQPTPHAMPEPKGWVNYYPSYRPGSRRRARG